MNLRPYRPQAVDPWTVEVLSLVDLDRWAPSILGVDGSLGVTRKAVRARRSRPIVVSPGRTLAQEEG